VVKPRLARSHDFFVVSRREFETHAVVDVQPMFKRGAPVKVCAYVALTPSSIYVADSPYQIQVVQRIADVPLVRVRIFPIAQVQSHPAQDFTCFHSHAPV
jgi:hypothetical protein